MFPLAAPPTPMRARPPDQVSVVTTPPSRPYVEAGLIEVQTPLEDVSANELVASLREKAASTGCDAVLLLGGQNARTTFPGNAVSMKSYRGTCLVFASAK